MVYEDIIEDELNQLVEVLFTDEHNYNNADSTSGQKAQDEDSIKGDIKEWINKNW